MLCGVGADDDTSTDELAALTEEYERAAETARQAQSEPARAVIASVRELLESFGASAAISNIELPRSDGGNTGGPYLPTFTGLVREPTALSQYQALAMLAACIRGWSQETGRSESEILDDLASNYEP
jgi:hypothetical protein